jgi:O-antigen ligase
VHSRYLQIGADLGVAGLVIFVAIAAFMLRGLHRSLRALAVVPEAGPLRALGGGVRIALVAFLVQAVVYPVAYNFYFYYVAGFAVAVQLMARGELRRQAENGRHA